ncbi:glycoside hydrolase family 2 protein [Roseibium sp.]|uniref:glycoside hydrolase family 2 protein n=1 Tax=Roseibium sp. TaxID=1936156 RepID=UPI003BAF40A7
MPEQTERTRMIDLSGISWTLSVTEAGAFTSPLVTGHQWDIVPAKVPGTVAAALAEAGRYDPDYPAPLHDKDVWYEGWFDAEPGDYRLCFEGLATIAEVYLNDTLALDSRNMFRRHEVPVTLDTRNVLKLCFRALTPHLEAKGPRARWKPQLATSQGLRLVRTTLLGHMPGWCPEIHAVGPYRPIRIEPADRPRISNQHVLADLAPDGSAALTVALRLENSDAVPVLSCAGSTAEMDLQEDGSYAATLRPETITPWMPHTHGTPALYDVTVHAADQTFALGKTGFRRVEADQGADGKGFGLKINGVPVFCRGAVWTSAELLSLAGDEETYRPLLEQARDAGMNMLRIGGTMLYETRAFFELCDELGLLVWQDFQFANYDYPVKDDAFVEEVRAEVRDQLAVSMGCPSLAVLCGGSEIYQQGAMMGLPESRWKGPLCEDILPSFTIGLRPDVPYVPNSPCGGTLPFSPNEGVAHYYGVGAYLRPLEDARRAEVRFAGECLAFSNIPSPESLADGLPVKPGHDPRWKARVPRDRGAGWDFEDVRDHYLKTLYGVDPAELRYGDPDRYLDFGRLVTGEVMERTFAEWRRPGSPCQGALVWTFQDLALGAGWGVVDAAGQPKPAYYGLKRAFRPLQVSVTDEGTNGLAIHAINDGPEEVAVTLSLSCLRDGQLPVVSGKTDLTLAPQSAQTLNAVDLIGAFFDMTYAYRFGPLSHDVTVVQLTDTASGELLADAFHRTGGELAPPHFDLPDCELRPEPDGSWQLDLTARRFLQSVSLSVPGYLPEDNWFHLAPGAKKRIRLKRCVPSEEALSPTGTLRAINLGRQLALKPTDTE